MDSVRFLYSAASLTFCSVYNPFIRCTFCREGKPPGFTMMPFSFGVTVLGRLIASKLTPRQPSWMPLVFQTLLNLLIQNVFTMLWADMDDTVMEYLNETYESEEDKDYYWNIIMFTFGLVITALSMAVGKCKKSHVYFDNHFEIKPYKFYMYRMVDKRVRFKSRNANKIK